MSFISTFSSSGNPKISLRRIEKKPEGKEEEKKPFRNKFPECSALTQRVRNTPAPPVGSQRTHTKKHERNRAFSFILLDILFCDFDLFKFKLSYTSHVIFYI